MRSLLATLILVFSELLVAAEQTTRTIDPLSNANLTKWTLGLLAVLLLIALVAWAVRRFSTLGITQTGGMQVLSGLSVGNREKVVLMTAGGRHILLGVTASQIQTLHVFDKGEIAEDKTPSRMSFEDSLKQALTKKVSL